MTQFCRLLEQTHLFCAYRKQRLAVIFIRNVIKSILLAECLQFAYLVIVEHSVLVRLLKKRHIPFFILLNQFKFVLLRIVQVFRIADVQSAADGIAIANNDILTAHRHGTITLCTTCAVYNIADIDCTIDSIAVAYADIGCRSILLYKLSTTFGTKLTLHLNSAIGTELYHTLYEFCTTLRTELACKLFFTIGTIHYIYINKLLIINTIKFKYHFEDMRMFQPHPP